MGGTKLTLVKEVPEAWQWSLCRDLASWMQFVFSRIHKISYIFFCEPWAVRQQMLLDCCYCSWQVILALLMSCTCFGHAQLSFTWIIGSHQVACWTLLYNNVSWYYYGMLYLGIAQSDSITKIDVALKLSVRFLNTQHQQCLKAGSVLYKCFTNNWIA